jgi:hypothetical protein
LGGVEATAAGLLALVGGRACPEAVQMIMRERELQAVDADRAGSADGPGWFEVAARIDEERARTPAQTRGVLLPCGSGEQDTEKIMGVGDVSPRLHQLFDDGHQPVTLPPLGVTRLSFGWWEA